MIEPRPFIRPAMTPESFRVFSETLIGEMYSSLGIPALLPGEYRNPFDFIDEHDQWFEFLRRKYFGKEATYDIIRDMLSDDLARAARAADTNYSSYAAAKLDADRFRDRIINSIIG